MKLVADWERYGPIARLVVAGDPDRARQLRHLMGDAIGAGQVHVEGDMSVMSGAWTSTT